jgi:hypothetical protein
VYGHAVKFWPVVEKRRKLNVGKVNRCKFSIIPSKGAISSGWNSVEFRILGPAYLNISMSYKCK